MAQSRLLVGAICLRLSDHSPGDLVVLAQQLLHFLGEFFFILQSLHVVLADLLLLAVDLPVLLIGQVDDNLSLLLLGQLLQVLKLLTLNRDILVGHDIQNSSFVVTLYPLNLLSSALVKLRLNSSFDLALLLPHLLAIKLLALSVTTVKSFLQNAIKLVFLLPLLHVKNVVDRVYLRLVFLKHAFFILVV